MVELLLAGFTKTVGLEMAQKGNITCNAICPGYVLTDLIRNQLEDTAKARGISKVCTRSLTVSAVRRRMWILSSPAKDMKCTSECCNHVNLERQPLQCCCTIMAMWITYSAHVSGTL